MQNRTTLTVYRNTLAEKIQLDQSKTAKGVVVSSHNQKFTLHANKEVILSAGAFQSPQLLMLSGIGPQEQLETHNIDTIVDLPGVGKNLKDDPLFGTGYPVNLLTASSLNDPAILNAAREAYNEQAAGPLTIPASGFLGWEKADRNRISSATSQALDAEFPTDWPELE